ncbi:hypothetical protein ACFWBM_39885, partial [Streptomyces sp. NPDC059980]
STVTDTAEATETAEAKPVRRRTRKAVADADIPAQATDDAEAKPATRRRTRKAAATEPAES